MLTTFASIKSYVDHIKFNPFMPKIDNFIFKLHYRVTFLMLLAFTILVCSREYFGEHIKCIADSVLQPVIHNFCFFASTFTIVRHYNSTLVGLHILPHPGVGPIGVNEQVRYHAYYQWVPFVLFAQAIMFYIPRYMWKKVEGGRMKALVDGLQLASLSYMEADMTTSQGTVLSKAHLNDKLDAIRTNIVLRLRHSKAWSTSLIACEVANLVNLMLQVWITNRFLNGLFIDLGPSIIGADFNGPMDPLDTIFPKMTKCRFHKYGPSGGIQEHDALCVMALNVINEKIYSILWFWYLALFILTVLGLIWRLCTFILYRHSARFNNLLFQRPKRHQFEPWAMNAVRKSWAYGDWLFLYYLSKNMDGLVFKQLFDKLGNELIKREVSKTEPGQENFGSIEKSLLENGLQVDIGARDPETLEADFKKD